MSKEAVKTIPKDKQYTQDMPKDKAPDRELSHYEIYPEGLKEISKALSDVISSKYVSQVIIMAINENSTPIFKD